jgi:uncharacterized membrane protein YccF (DUF307 family)
MNTLGNILWFIFGGIFVAIEYAISSLILCITIIGIPFGVQTFKLARLSLFPFGKKTVINEKSDGCLSLFMNILWILVGGIWISITHIIFGAILFITIIGIPFAKQHFKLASVALLPFGRDIVDE